MANFLRLLSDMRTDRRTDGQQLLLVGSTFIARPHPLGEEKKNPTKPPMETMGAADTVTLMSSSCFLNPDIENRCLSASLLPLPPLPPPPPRSPLADAPDWMCGVRETERRCCPPPVRNTHTHTERDTHMHAHTVIQPPHPTSLRSGTEDHGKCSFSTANGQNNTLKCLTVHLCINLRYKVIQSANPQSVHRLLIIFLLHILSCIFVHGIFLFIFYV